ncbi:MAG: DUF4394 domain-containing protein [Casimicrobium sp.]
MFGLFAALSNGAPILWTYQNSAYVSFRADAPGTILNTVNDVGSAYSPYSFDFRPTTGELYALYFTGPVAGGDAYAIQRINLTTGYIQQIGNLGPGAVPTGSRFGMAFDPYFNQIRVVTNGGRHFPLNPESGGSIGFFSDLGYVSGDSGAGIAPTVEHIAFDNAIPNPSFATLYGIDTGRNVLVRIGAADVPGSSGSSNLTTITPITLGFDPGNDGGFVIDPATRIGYLATNVSGSGRLYSINLVSGTATSIGVIGAGSANIRGLALAPGVNHCLDIDGDGQVLAHRDGLMLARISLGMTGASVLANAIPSVNPPPRRTWDAIRVHLINNCGMTIAP